MNSGYIIIKLRLVLLIVLTFILVPTIATFGDSTSTIMFRGNPQHTGYAGNQNKINKPKTKWMFKTNGRIFSSPVINKEIVFFGSSDSCLYAVHENDGSLKWKFRTQGEVKSTPLIYEGTIYFISMDGIFYAISEEDASIKWSFKTEGEKLFQKMGFSTDKKNQLRHDPWDFWLSSAVTDGERVYFGCGDGNLYALNIIDGSKAWSFKTNDVVHSSPALYKGKLYFGSMDHFFYAVDAATGNQAWKFATGQDTQNWVMTGIHSSPAIENDIVYFGCRDATMYGLNTVDGGVKLRYGTGGSWVLASPSLYKNRIYFGTSDTRLFLSLANDGKSMNFNRATKGYVFSSAAICDSATYVGCYNGTLYCVNTETGSVNWLFETEGHKRDSLKVLNSSDLVVPIWDDTNDSTLMASNIRLYSVGTIVSSPLVHNGDVYFGSTDGNLYALTEDNSTSVEEDKLQGNLNFKLEQNFPNPFNPGTRLNFRIPRTGYTSLKVYDTLGNEVATLVNEEKAPGNYSTTFDGSTFSSGLYFYKLISGNYSETKKMLLLK